MMNVFFNIIVSPIELLIESAYAFLITVVGGGNQTFAILGISILVTILCLPLYTKAELIQEKERTVQRKMAKRIASIRKCFKGDERHMILSMYYRENHYHPLMALRSSLSLLIQIPFFIAAYSFLSHFDALKGESFFIIRDIGSPDGLLSIGSITINILPIIMTGINIASSIIYTQGFSLREKLQLYVMALIFLVLLYSSPAALVLYWTFNNIFSLIKNIVFKFKIPIRILYFSIIIGLFFACIYVIFYRSQSDPKDKILSIIISIMIAAIPIYIKIINYFAKKYFYHLKKQIRNIHVLFFLVCGAVWILCGIIIPFNVVASDPTEFYFISQNQNPFSVLLPIVLISFGLFGFWPAYMYLIFSDKIKLFLSFGMTIVLFLGIIDTFFFPCNYGMLSRTLTFPSDPIFLDSLVSLIKYSILFCIILCITVLFFKIGKIGILSTLFSILLLGGISIAVWKTVDIQKKYTIDKKTIADDIASVQKSHLKQKLKPVITLSKTGNNVIIIMLDRAIGSYLPLIFNEREELKTAFSGFTYYPNTVSFFRSTNLGTPPLFGGYEYTPERLHERKTELMAEKHTEAVLMLPTLFQQQGYSVSVFDMPYINYHRFMDTNFFLEKGIKAGKLLSGQYNVNLLSELGKNAPIEFKIDIVLRHNFVMFSLFNIVPPFLRGAIYYHGSYWNALIQTMRQMDIVRMLDNYSGLYILPELTDTSENVNTLTILDNELPHNPAFLQYPDYTITSEITDIGPDYFRGDTFSLQHYHVNAASYILLGKWFDALRNMGVYENTRIIIASDHDMDNIVKPLFSDSVSKINSSYNPVLLVKDFNAEGNLKTDMSFMTNADVPFLAVHNLIFDPRNPFTGNEINQDKENGVNILANGSVQIEDYPGYRALDRDAQFYHVQDNIFMEENWKKFTRRYDN
jgi:YidC/Oxa1 family membrane protein insertase